MYNNWPLFSCPDVNILQILSNSGLFHNGHSAIAPVETSCLAGWYYSMQPSTPIKATSFFFLPQATHIVTFTTTKTNQQRGSILLGLRLLSVCPSSKVASAISLSPWGYSCQSSTMLRTCVVLETFRTWLTSSLRGDITNLALPFLYQNPRILDLTLPTKVQYVLVVVNLTLKLAYKLVNCSRNLFYISLVLVNPLTLTISFSPSLFKAQYFR